MEITSAVGDGDAATSPSKFFWGQIWLKFRLSWAKFRQIWEKFGQI